MEINYEDLGKRIRIFRKKSHLTQAQLAEMSNLNSSNISHIERGATKVSLPTLIKIANSLSVSLDELIYDSLNKNGHISIKELNELLKDCNDHELNAILELIRSTKNIILQK